MSAKKFSIDEAIQFGWKTTKDNLGFFVGLLVAVGLIYIIPSIVIEAVKEKNAFLGAIFSIADWVLVTVVSIGLIRISLNFCDGKKMTLEEALPVLFNQYRLFFKILVASILYNLIVGTGLILLIIPGIIWGIKFGFYEYFVVDKGADAVDSLKKSSAITKGVKWDLFVFGILLAIINLIGSVCLLVGLFVTIPTTMIALTFVYRKLSSQEEIPQPSPEISPETSKVY